MRWAPLLACVGCGRGPLLPDGGSDAGSDAGGDAGPTTIVRVHYPAGGHALTLRGGSPPLSWDAGSALTAAGQDVYTWSATGLTQPLELKPLLDDATWSRGPNYRVEPGATLEVYPTSR